MSTALILTILLLYFIVLVGISYLTGRKADNQTFFTGNRNNKWYVVAFGMVGASLSGVTFISIPGWVEGSGFTYMQMSVGYIVGYAIIAFVLLPLYYRLNLISIYGYLEKRYGVVTYKMGAAFFVISRLIGAAFRLFLVANVLQEFLFKSMGVPFEITVTISILLIWVYTFKGGIKTIIWTDTLQTLFMLISVGLSVYLISDQLNLELSNIYTEISNNGMGTFWQTTDGNAKNYWIKGLLGGMFLTLGMTGVDQDMMQKNLTCRSVGAAQKNMLSLSVVLLIVNFVFLSLGGLLYLYMDANPDLAQFWMEENNGDSDLLFATIALEGGLPIVLGVFFLLGLIAAAYSSADSALTSLTTSVSIDFFDIKHKSKSEQVKVRKLIHILMSVALLVTILLFKMVKEESVVEELFSAATYTYGPLLGLFLFGVFSKRKVQDIYAACVTIGIAILSYLFIKFGGNIYGAYAFGAELLGINAGLVFLLLLIGPKPKSPLVFD